jgi:hypothetical protein
VDLSGFDPREVPATEIQRQQKRLSMQKSGADLWLLRCMEAGALPRRAPSPDSRTCTSAFAYNYQMHVSWEGQRSKASVYEHYRSQAGSNPRSAEAFWKQLRAIIPYQTIQQKASMLLDREACQLVAFPPLEECKAAFRNYMADPNWSFEDMSQTDANRNSISITAAVTAPQEKTTMSTSDADRQAAAAAGALSLASANAAAVARSPSSLPGASSFYMAIRERYGFAPPTGPFLPLDARPSMR